MGGGGGSIDCKGGLNLVCHAFDIANNVIVPKAQHAEFMAAQIIVARGIDALARRGVVLAAINFDDKAR
jgi:hypothetical protein